MPNGLTTNGAAKHKLIKRTLIPLGINSLNLFNSLNL